MAGGPELEITADLSDALTWVLGAAPTEPAPVLVLAAYLDSVAKGYGLSESQHFDVNQLESADPPAQALPLITHLLADSNGRLDEDSLRARLYTVFVSLSQDRSARQIVNRSRPLGEVELLTLGQIYWNLEATDARPRLPIKPRAITAGGKKATLDIPAHGATRDFATMKWTARVNERGPNKSSGQGFRKQGARLAVLAARLIVEDNSEPPPAMDDTVLRLARIDGGASRIASIAWPAPEGPSVPDQSGAAHGVRSGSQPEFVGPFAELGQGYQWRGFDAEIERLWADGGDRRLWLRGGPGLGKSYCARRVMRDASMRPAPDREDLLLWVDSADATSTKLALSQAVDRMPQLGLSLSAEEPNRLERQARRLLGAMATSAWRWLVVLDNADAESLLESGLMPPGTNPNGRVLVTTLSQDHRIVGHGRLVRAEVFTPVEAEAYLRGRLDPANGGAARLASAPRPTLAALARAVGHHPLALSIAASTIVAYAMDPAEWIAEFRASERMDEAADKPDEGGYPTLIGATWRVALDKASRGLPHGVVERAAAVAAVLDPNGHPTWLWDREAVQAWVAGDSGLLERLHGQPRAVQLLIEYGLLDLIGGTWKRGRLTIHPLAARAVRELMDAKALVVLADVLLHELANDERSLIFRGSLGSLEQLLTIPGTSLRNRSEGLHVVGGLLVASGDLGAGLAAMEESAAIAESLLGSEDAVDESWRADLLALLGAILTGLERPGEARLRFIEALDVYRRTAEADGISIDELAHCLRGLGQVQDNLGLGGEAEASLARAAEAYQQLVTNSGSDKGKLPGYLVRLGGIQARLGRLDAAEESLARAVLTSREGAHEDPAVLDWFLSQALPSLASVREALGRRHEAAESRAEAVRSLERLAGAGANWAKDSLVQALDALGQSLFSDPGRRGEAETYLVRAVSIASELADADPGSHDLDQAKALESLGTAQQENGRLEEAADSLTRAVRIRELLAEMLPKAAASAPRHWRALTWALLNLSRVHKELGHLTEAMATAAHAVEIAQRLTEADPGGLDSEVALAAGLQSLGLLQSRLGQVDAAAASFTSCVRIGEFLVASDAGKYSRLLLAALDELSKTLLRLGRWDEAHAAVVRAIELSLSDDTAE